MSLVRGTSIVASLTLVSRILGFVREVLIARLFGASAFSDAFFVAFRIPNVLRSLFAEGALTSAFVPVFAGEKARGLSDAQRAFSAVLGALLLSSSFIALLGMIWAEEIVSLFAPGFDTTTERFSLCVDLTRIMFPYIVFVSVVALLNGTLNAFSIYGASAWAQVVMNMSLIIAAYGAGYYEQRVAAFVLGWSVVVGGAIQVVAQLPALGRAGLRFRPTLLVWIPPVKRVLTLMIPAIFGAAIYQITIFFNTLLASLLETGSVSWLSYADRVAQLPVGVFTIALSSVLLPTLSTASASDDSEAFSRNLSDALRYTSFVMIPASAALILFAHPLTILVFERGQFDPHASHETARAVVMYALGLWAISCHAMTVRALQARHDTITPVVLGVLVLGGTFVTSLLCMGPLVQSDDSLIFSWILFTQGALTQWGALSLGAAGVALASSVAFLLAFLVAMSVVMRRNREFSILAFCLATANALGASIGATVAASAALALVSTPLASLVWGGGVFVVTLLFLLWLLRTKEFRESCTLIKKKFF